MAWLDEIDDASFRGVAFQVEKLTLRGGQRVANHEYPMRNTPYSEPLGGRQKVFSFTGFVDSTNGFAARNAFIAALDTNGSGLLIHPTYGQLQVTAGEYILTENLIEERNISRFALTFYDSGDDVDTTPTADTAQGVSDAADDATSANTGAFATTISESWA